MLRKGLSFIPMARDISRTELLSGFDAFRAKLRRSNDTIPAKKTTNSFFPKTPLKFPHKPTIYLPPLAEGILDEIRLDLYNLPTQQTVPNLSKNERAALAKLKKNKNLVINHADKGSSIVIQNRWDYIKYNEDHLQDPLTYTRLDGDPTRHLCEQISSLLAQFKSQGFLSEEMYRFCLPPEHARLARFYSLLKIHKTPPKIRPIVSSCDSPTENISQFLDHWLQPSMRNLPSFLQNTNQLIKELHSIRVPANSWLVTVDVKSLYTTIPHKEGLEACRNALLATEKSYPEQPPTEPLATLMELVLQNNTFEFNDQVYKQLNGVAMGTKMAVAYANIFMGSLETKLLSKSSLKICFYKRYIDDILIITDDTEDHLTNFIRELNEFHPTIKFTAEYHQERITFLDVDIYKGPNFNQTQCLDFETHIKATNPRLHVHALSHHPDSVKKGIIIGEVKRLLRTNSNRETFNKSVIKYETQMQTRGYSLNFIKSLTNKIRFEDRDLLLAKQKSNRKTPPRTIFSARYTPTALKANQIIRKYWPKIRQMSSLSNKAKSTPLFVPHTNKNLRNHLVRAKLPHLDKGPHKPLSPTTLPLQVTTLKSRPPSPFRQCHLPECFLHKLINQSPFVKSSINNRSHPIREEFHCLSPNTIYLITCSKCNIQFIDFSPKPLRIAITHHLQMTNTAKIQLPALPIHAHYMTPHHKMSIQPLETTIPALSESLCNTWVQRLQCLYPLGLNT